MIKLYLILGLVSLVLLVILQKKWIDDGKLEKPQYSFNAVLKVSLYFFSCSIVVSIATYFLSKRFEVAISIFAILLSLTISGLILGMLREYHGKARGYDKKD